MSTFSQEQWTRIKELFSQARELPAEYQETFLEGECGGDPVIRAEVVRLLNSAEQSQGPLDSPPFQIPIRSNRDASIPQTIGRYTILEKLGQGGMGAVYHGQDPALKRQVAIKVLLPEQTGDPDWRRRLVREAQAASALNHPHIITVYDIGTHQGGDYIAMEYVDGVSLRERIGKKALTMSTALKYAIQIADALAAAHSAGIIHRDLKPANIMVTDADSIKILDFGLAKSIAPSRPLDDTGRSSHHLVVGTAAYMSPEQAQGQVLDERTDVFSFGSVFYEMLTGRRAFQGNSSISTLSSVLSTDPQPLADINPACPPEIQRIVESCLRKERTQRLRHMGDLKLGLEVLQGEVDHGARRAHPRIQPVSRWKQFTASLVLFAIGAAGASGWWWFRTRPAPPQPATLLTQLTADAGLSAYPSMSPDGRLLAYASDRDGEGNLDIWVQHVSGGEPIRLAPHEADDYDPDFSPDGSKIAFRSDRDGGGIYIVSSLGGQPQLIAPRGRNPHFSPDGKWILYWEGDEGAGLIPNSARMHVVSSTGGLARQVRPEFAAGLYPIWTNNGTQVLFLGRLDPKATIAQTVDWWLAPLEGGPAKKTGARELLRTQKLSAPLGQIYSVPLAWQPATGRVIFSAALGDTTNLWEVQLLPDDGKVTGAPQRVTFGIGSQLQASIGAERNGRSRVCYSNLVLNVNVWKLGLDGRLGKVKGKPELLTNSRSFDGYPSLSANGSKLAFRSSRGGRSTVRTRDLVTGQESVICESTYPLLQPRISPNGSKVAYWDRIDQGYVLFWSGFRGGSAERLCEGCGPPTDISPDGQKILFEPLHAPEDVMMLETSSGAKIHLVHADTHPNYVLFGGRFSPDSQWVSFHATVDKSANRRIFVVPVQDGKVTHETEWIPITDGSKIEEDTCWSPDGLFLYFMSERDGFRCIWAQRLDRAHRRPVGSAFAVQHFHHARLSLRRLGRRGGAVGLSVAHDKLIFAMGEMTGNIWLSEPGGVQ